MTPNDSTQPTNSEITQAQASTAMATAPTTSNGIGLKELLIPISIAIAGAFIGLGLYFGGMSGNAFVQAPAVNQQGQQAADATDKVAEVTNDDWIKGTIDAPIVIVEYSDFDCPFCSRFHATMDQVVEESDGQVAWVYRHFPLEQLHPQAAGVALAAECVGEQAGQEGFWKFTDRYFELRGAQDTTAHGVLIPQLAIEAGADQTAFTTCFENTTYASKIQAHMDNAIETGGRGTPWSILIGPSGKTYPINGAQTKQAVQQLVNLALQEA